MKKIFAYIVSALAAVMVLSSCDPSDFGDINKSPNSPSTAYTSYLFTNACRYVPYFVLGSATNGYNVWQQAWPGYLSESKNNQYGVLGVTSEFGVGTYYLYALKNLQYIIDMNEDPEQKDLVNVAGFGTSANQIAAAKTLMGFYYMSITDIIGPVVISEAFLGAKEDNWTPKYDTQQEAYTILDNTLKEAYSQFDTSGSLDGGADVLYGGDIAKWKKFNATLRMLMAIKLCDVDPATGKSRFATAYADGGMTSVDDSFNFTYDDLNWNMMYYWCSPDYSGAGFCWVPNMFIVDQMKEFQDPRMFDYFDIEGYRGKRDPELFPRDQYTSFYGVPFGLVDNAAVNAWVDCCCSINSNMIQMSATIPVIPTSRVLFTEAEAALRGWISADAKTLYEAGIKSSFEWWGTDGADKYISSPKVAYSPDNAMEQIALQRWIAGYLADGIEAWSDWRRLDIPHLPVGPGAVDAGNTSYPYRLAFSASQGPRYNTANYEIALQDISGPDVSTSRVWWDVKDNWTGVIPDEQCKPSVTKPAKWEAVKTGTYYVLGGGSANEDPVGADVWGASDFTTTLYKDVNHDGDWKLAPFGDNEALELKYDAASDAFFVPSQKVGSITVGDTTYPVFLADFDTDQGTENGHDYRAWWDKDDDGNDVFVVYALYRAGGPRGTEANAGLVNYGYDLFVPGE